MHAFLITVMNNDHNNNVTDETTRNEMYFKHGFAVAAKKRRMIYQNINHVEMNLVLLNIIDDNTFCC